MVLNDKGNPPTKKMKDSVIKRIWSKQKIKGKLNEHEVRLINIKIISNHGKVNYDFDELKH